LSTLPHFSVHPRLEMTMPNNTRQPETSSKNRLDLLEINISLVYICVEELHLKPAAHLDAFIPVE
jgi:hypothetical protein